MHLEDEMSADLVVRQFHGLQRILQVLVPHAAATTGTIGADDEVALCIVATRGTHHIDKSLGIAVDGVIGRGGDSFIILFGCGKRREAP